MQLLNEMQGLQERYVNNNSFKIAKYHKFIRK